MRNRGYFGTTGAFWNTPNNNKRVPQEYEMFKSLGKCKLKDDFYFLTFTTCLFIVFVVSHYFVDVIKKKKGKKIFRTYLSFMTLLHSLDSIKYHIHSGVLGSVSDA